MNVDVVVEGIHHRINVCHARKHAQLDLMIVAAQKDTSLAWQERLAHFPSHFIADTDVLKIGIRGGKSPRRSCALVEHRMDSAVTGNIFLQPFRIGRLDLCGLAVIQYIRNDRIRKLILFEHIRRGGTLLSPVQTKLIIKNGCQLTGTVDVERMTRPVIDLRLQRRHPLCHIVVDSLKNAAVADNAGILHIQKNPCQRHLDLCIKIIHSILTDLYTRTGKDIP